MAKRKYTPSEESNMAIAVGYPMILTFGILLINHAPHFPGTAGFIISTLVYSLLLGLASGGLLYFSYRHRNKK